jgi:hypothetical protein
VLRVLRAWSLLLLFLLLLARTATRSASPPLQGALS